MSLTLADWVNRTRSLWEEEAVSRLSEHQAEFDALVASLGDQQEGFYDQVADNILGTPGGPLDAATNYVSGSYYTLTVAGVFTTSIPELTGLTGAPGDAVVSNGTIWQLVTVTGLYAVLAEANTFTASPQAVRSAGPTDVPEFSIQDSAGNTVLRFYYNEATNTANLLTALGVPLYIQNRDPGGSLNGPVVGDNLAVTSQGPGTVTAEVDFWIKDEYSMRAIGTAVDTLETEAPYSRLLTDNTWLANNQNIQVVPGAQRPAWQLSNASATVGEFYHNAPTDVVALLAYAGRALALQPGASGGVTVRSPTYTPAQGELSVEGKVYAEGEELIKQVNALTWTPMKGFAVEFNGTLAIQHSYNVTAVTFQGAGTGVYRVQTDQDTINGNPIADVLIPAVNVVAPDALGEAVFARYQPGAPAGFLDVFVFTMAISGQNLLDDPYDLGPNDVVWMSALLNVELLGAEPLPP
jgi:hypothetical protein